MTIKQRFDRIESRLDAIEKVMLEFIELLDKPLNLNEAAQFLKLPYTEVRRLAMAGLIKCRKDGKHFYFNKAVLNEWLKDNQERMKYQHYKRVA